MDFAEQSFEFEEYQLLFVKVNGNLVLLQTYQDRYQGRVLMLRIKQKHINH